MLQSDTRGLPPFYFDADSDPDSAFHFDANPDPAIHFDADPGPGPTSQNDAESRSATLLCKA